MQIFLNSIKRNSIVRYYFYLNLFPSFNIRIHIDIDINPFFTSNIKNLTHL